MGGLVSYDVDLRWLYWRAAHFVDKILKDTRPGDLPVVFPPGFWLAANVGRPNFLACSLLATLLTRTDEVIE